jgi:hypothetical protein
MRGSEVSMNRISLVFVVAAALAAGCSKKDGDKGAGGAGDKAGGGGAPAAVKLSKLGLTLDAPGKVDVADGIGGDGHMLTGSGVGAFSVETAKTPATLDEAKEDAKMYTPKNLKDETLPDGWALTFENKGAAGTNYWVDVRRSIDGKIYKCGTTGSDAGQAAAVLAACKSLRK